MRVREKEFVDASRPITEHVKELRTRLLLSLGIALLAAVGAFVFFEPINALLRRPFALVDSSLEGTTLFVGTIVEGFMTRLRVSALTGLFLTIPFHVVNALRFIMPGLTSRERRVVTISVIVSFLLVVGSAYYGYSIIVPVSVSFLTSAGLLPEGVGMILNYQQNIGYVFQFLLATLVVFQVPILLEVLMMMGVLSRRALLRSSRYVVVGTFLFSAILTPPDFISQVGLAIPLIALYFLSIGVARVFGFGE